MPQTQTYIWVHSFTRLVNTGRNASRSLAKRPTFHLMISLVYFGLQWASATTVHVECVKLAWDS